MATNSNELLDEEKSALWQRFTKNPFLVVGFGGFLATAAIGLYRFKTRPKNMSPALYLVQLRVASQSVVIGSLTIGMVYGMINHHLLKRD